MQALGATALFLVDFVDALLVNHILVHHRYLVRPKKTGLDDKTRTIMSARQMIIGGFGYNEFIQYLATVCVKMQTCVGDVKFELPARMQKHLLLLLGSNFIEDFYIDLDTALKYVVGKSKEVNNITEPSWYR